MMAVSLETIVQQKNYHELPETWRLPSMRFSAGKTLYDYQEDALRNAARALFLYYDGQHDWQAGEESKCNNARKACFANRYGGEAALESLAIRLHESPSDKRKDRENIPYTILSPYLSPYQDTIHYRECINRMCFWMATGSGKTLVMVKLIEYLHTLQRHGEIPKHKILILVPTPHLLTQIRHTIDEFNQSGMHIELVPLRESHNDHRQKHVFETITVYYHLSHNIADEDTKERVDYKRYEDDGNWYIILDEAHKGGKEDSKRQAYYQVMARQGFLFNFSATFTDPEDKLTTVKNYNLEEFTKNGHGKNIYLNHEEFDAFRRGQKNVDAEERKKIILKSLVTLAAVSQRVDDLRHILESPVYHKPLMITLVNSVNTDIENNDLWAFFETLRQLAAGDIEQDFFESVRDEVAKDWQRDGKWLFGEGNSQALRAEARNLSSMTIESLRQHIFLSPAKGALEVIRSKDKKEIAFKLKSADSPFALIRIGDTSKWRNTLLANYEYTEALRETSFFTALEEDDSSITILMGSRSFFESWDSNRPNVINFINIGSGDAKKFLPQAIGRGVRIQPLGRRHRTHRQRLVYLTGVPEAKSLLAHQDKVCLPETLFLFATNHQAIVAVLEGIKSMEADSVSSFVNLQGFEKAEVPVVKDSRGQDIPMPLLVPEYQKKGQNDAPFHLCEEDSVRLKAWLDATSDSVLLVRDNLSPSDIDALRTAATQKNGIKDDPKKHYARLAFLQERLVEHLSQTVATAQGVRELKEDNDDKDHIIHFRHIRVHRRYQRDLQDKINSVREGKVSDKMLMDLVSQLQEGKITRQEYDKRAQGKDKELFEDDLGIKLEIKRLAQHYYLPVILGDEKADYIQHVIKTESEVNFCKELENWLGRKEPTGWDAWMFSKIDDALDRVYIPYYDGSFNEYRRFFPDFVFWLCQGNNYDIVFVDPKGTEQVAAERKIDGYQKLFESNAYKARDFDYKGLRVRVRLLMFNPSPGGSRAYQHFWTNNPKDIFIPPQTP